MQDPVDPRRINTLNLLLAKLNTITKDIRIVETIPFKTPLIINLNLPIKGFNNHTNTFIATVFHIQNLTLELHLIAIRKKKFYYEVTKRNEISITHIYVEWVQDWKILEKEDLPLTLDYEIKYPPYNKLFQ